MNTIDTQMPGLLSKHLVKIKGHSGLWLLTGTQYDIIMDVVNVRFTRYENDHNYVTITVSMQSLAASSLLNTLKSYIEFPKLTLLEKIIYDIN